MLELFALSVGAILFPVHFGDLSSDILPEFDLRPCEVILVNGYRPTVGEPLQSRAFGWGQSANYVFASRLHFGNEFPLFAVARASALVVGGIECARLVATVGNNIRIVRDSILMIACDRGTGFAITIPSRIMADRIDDLFIRSHILTVRSAPVCRAERAHCILVAYSVAIDGVERKGYVLLPTTAVALDLTVNAVSLEHVNRIVFAFAHPQRQSAQYAWYGVTSGL